MREKCETRRLLPASHPIPLADTCYLSRGTARIEDYGLHTLERIPCLKQASLNPGTD